MNKTKNKKASTSRKSTSMKGISTNPSGSYRARKIINGVCYDRSFNHKKDAIGFLLNIIAANIS